MKRAAWLQDRRMQKFVDVLSRWERKELSAMDASEILGCSERQFRRHRRRYEEEGLEGLFDKRLDKASARRVPIDKLNWMLSEYRTRYTGWAIKHFHEHLQKQHNFRWSYTWVKTQLHTARLVLPAARRGAHRRKRPRKPCVGMMLHQDGSRFAWLEGEPELDLIVTMDDATSEIYSAFLVAEEGTASTFRALLEVFAARGLPSSLYTDRGSHYFLTPKAGEPVDKERLTQVGRALSQLGIVHIPAYSPEARGRSERTFGTLQGRLPKELRLFGITDIEEANRYIREIYLPMHNKLFARPPQIPEESGFVPVHDPARLADVLCVQQSRVVGRDNTVSFEGHSLQLPQTPARAHYVKANVRVHEYPDGTLAIFHGPRRLARYNCDGGEEIVDASTSATMTPCSPPSRRGLAMQEPVEAPQRRPALTASARGVQEALQVGTKKRLSGRTKKLTRADLEPITPAAA
jgi:transposase